MTTITIKPSRLNFSYLDNLIPAPSYTDLTDADKQAQALGYKDANDFYNSNK